MTEPACSQCSTKFTPESIRSGTCVVCGAILPRIAAVQSQFPFTPRISDTITEDPNATEVMGPIIREDKTQLAEPSASLSNVEIVDESKPNHELDIGLTRMPDRSESAVSPTHTAQQQRLHPTEQLVTQINHSRDSLTGLASRLQDIAVKVGVVSGMILMLGWIYLSRPMAAAAPPPQGVATMINETQGQIPVYLASLKRLDSQRMALITSLSQAMTGQADAQTGLVQGSQDLPRDFLALKAPDACTSLANSYFQLVQDQTAMINKASVSLKTNDVKDAQAAHDAAQQQIVLDAAAADTALTQLCANQQTAKPFNIIAEPGSTTAPNTNASPSPITRPTLAPLPSSPALPNVNTNAGNQTTPIVSPASPQITPTLPSTTVTPSVNSSQ